MKEFNIATSCVPSMHYMVDISKKIEEIKKIIDSGKYFTVNRARQFGKTTVRYELEKALSSEYIVLNISFESIGDDTFKNEETLSSEVFNIFADSVRFVDSEFEKELRTYGNGVKTLKELSNRITDFCVSNNKKIVLMIDEVDKSSNNQLFLNFIGILRNKYIARNVGRDVTFWSIVLFGVHDVKNLKLKLNDNGEEKYNSPWNVAVDFKVDMAFNPFEISTMLIEYEKDYHTGMDIDKISNLIYDYTSGYPFLVSKLSKLMHEDLNQEFTEVGVIDAIKILLIEKNTLFDDMMKNFENNKELYNLIYKILIEGKNISFSIDNPVIEIANVYGIIKNNNGVIQINNKIFETRIYNYMISKRETGEGKEGKYIINSEYIMENGNLDMVKILDKFQDFMYREYRTEDKDFYERQGRLIFLSWIKPIINGIGFYDVESETRNNKRMDIVVTYNKKRYIIELKIWRGKEYENKGIEQLVDYLNIQNENIGYYVLFDFNKEKKIKKGWIEESNKKIYEIII